MVSRTPDHALKATYDRYLKLRLALQALAESAPQQRGKDRWLRVEMALVLAEATGARIGAISALQWADFTANPFRLQFRSEHDKRSRGRVVPLPEELGKELQRFQRRLSTIGQGWMFPRTNEKEHWSREIFDQQLRLAVQHAGLEHLKGGLWHPFRRKWATERKEMALVDVKAAGGWKDTNTLLTCYQHTDEASMLNVMASPNKLRSLEAV